MQAATLQEDPLSLNSGAPGSAQESGGIWVEGAANPVPEPGGVTHEARHKGRLVTKACRTRGPAHRGPEAGRCPTVSARRPLHAIGGDTPVASAFLFFLRPHFFFLAAFPRPLSTSTSVPPPSYETRRVSVFARRLPIKFFFFSFSDSPPPQSIARFSGAAAMAAAFEAPVALASQDPAMSAECVAAQMSGPESAPEPVRSLRTAHDLGGPRTRTGDVLLAEPADFESLLLSRPVLEGLRAAGFERPSPVQLKAIPLGRCGLGG